MDASNKLAAKDFISIGRFHRDYPILADWVQRDCCAITG